jgi:hypothetical protein
VKPKGKEKGRRRSSPSSPRNKGGRGSDGGVPARSNTEKVRGGCWFYRRADREGLEGELARVAQQGW